MMKRTAPILAALYAVLATASTPATIDAWEDAQSAQARRAQPGDFVWHDLVTENPTAARAFYGALFGWTFETADGVDPGYTIIKRGQQPIAGMVPRKRAPDEEVGAQWLAYVVVADVDRAAAAFREAGGRVFRGPLNARKDLRVVAVADAQGAPLGLASRGPHSDTGGGSELNEWLWMEYVARDPDAALKFYGDVLGYRHEVSEQREGFTYHLLSNDRPRAGLFRSLFSRPTSVWLPYIRVADPAAMAARVTELGGTVVIAPSPRARNGSLAVVLDPAGAVLALQKFPFDKDVTP
jgi:predicted enzyme related to lactoylglutathione lyase